MPEYLQQFRLLKSHKIPDKIKTIRQSVKVSGNSTISQKVKSNSKKRFTSCSPMKQSTNFDGIFLLLALLLSDMEKEPTFAFQT